MKKVVYNHHGVDVVVREDLKGKHRDFCLCFDNCMRFKPGTPQNCPIAQAVYRNCVAFGITTPMWECPEYAQSDSEE